MMNNGKNNGRMIHRRWRYAPTAIFLHWTLAILIAGMMGLGWYMMSIEDTPGSSWYFNLHKSTGLVVFALVLLRLTWRSTHHPGQLPAQLSVLQARLAVLTHWLLYAGMVVMPVTGLLGATFSKSGLIFFGTKLPAWAAPNHDRSEQFFAIHSTVIWILLALIVVHVLAALKHRFIDKDEVFDRMWF